MIPVICCKDCLFPWMTDWQKSEQAVLSTACFFVSLYYFFLSVPMIYSVPLGKRVVET